MSEPPSAHQSLISENFNKKPVLQKNTLLLWFNKYINCLTTFLVSAVIMSKNNKTTAASSSSSSSPARKATDPVVSLNEDDESSATTIAMQLSKILSRIERLETTSAAAPSTLATSMTTSSNNNNNSSAPSTKTTADNNKKQYSVNLPQKFSDHLGSVDARTFVDEFEAAMAWDSYHGTRHEFVAHFQQQLDGAARTWFLKEATPIFNNGGWPGVKTAFFARFDDPLFKARQAEALLDLRLASLDRLDEHIRAFDTALTKLELRADAKHFAIYRVIFERSLPKALRTECSRIVDNSYDTYFSQVRAAGLILRQQQSRNGSAAATDERPHHRRSTNTTSPTTAATGKRCANHPNSTTHDTSECRLGNGNSAKAASNSSETKK